MSKEQFNRGASFDASMIGGAVDIQSLANFEPVAAENKEAARFSPEALMHSKRVVVIGGQVDANLAYRTIVYLKHLEEMDKEAPITLLINSPGGSVIDGMAMYDIIRQIKCPIVTIGNGMQASMGSIMLASGDQRFMTPSADLMIHQIMTGANGGTQHTDFEIRSGHTARLHETLKSVYVEFTGLNHAFWDKVMERDTWLTAEQALKIGFINGVTEAGKAGGKYASDATRVRKPDSLTQVVLDKIATMPKEEVLDYLNNGQADMAEWGRFRPELVVRLAEFPEFWTAGRRAEAGLSASNDDKKPAATRSSRKAQGPSA